MIIYVLPVVRTSIVYKELLTESMHSVVVVAKETSYYPNAPQDFLSSKQDGGEI
jgi:hypothetical protein